MSEARAEHRAFLNKYYGISRAFYDITRKYYLFGRDTCLKNLGRESWGSLVEVGPGTGRNLERLHAMRPQAQFGGVDASDAMIAAAVKRCPWARVTHGFAEDADLTAAAGGPPDRVLFSYCLSMVQDVEAAVLNARRHLSPTGRVVVVDFGDFAGLPAPAADAFRAWLETFRVRPIDTGALAADGFDIHWGPLRYFFIATAGPLRE